MKMTMYDLEHNSWSTPLAFGMEEEKAKTKAKQLPQPPLSFGKILVIALCTCLCILRIGSQGEQGWNDLGLVWGRGSV